MTDQQEYLPAPTVHVSAEAFHEWAGPKGSKQLLKKLRRDLRFLSTSGLLSFWKPNRLRGRPIPTVMIMTTEPNRWMARIHDQIPVLLSDDADGIEVSLGTLASDVIQLVYAPIPKNFLAGFPVGKTC